MDNKTKVKVAVVIGIVALAVIFIFMVIFVKGNKTPVNKNIPRKGDAGFVDPTQNTTNTTTKKEEETVPGSNVTLDDVVCLGIKNGNLVKINSDLTSVDVKKLESGFKDYCYGDKNVYTVIDNEDGTYSVIEIDLTKSNYPEKNIITTGEYGAINNIEYYGGKLYFVSQIGQLIEYSISENYFRALTAAGEVSSFVINKKDNNIIVSYMPGGVNSGIYTFDFTQNNFTQFIALDELAGDLILNGNSLIIDVKGFNSLYLYDMESGSVVAIGADNYLNKAENHIAFYDNVLLYTNGSAIDLKKSSGEDYQENWYVLNDGTIADISMIDSSKMQIARYDAERKVTRSIIIDLSNGETTEKPDVVYTDIIKIK